MQRWKVSVTWHVGYERATWAVESYDEGERTSCLTAEVDCDDDLQAALLAAGYGMKQRANPTLF